MLSATTYVSQLHKYSISEDSGEEEAYLTRPLEACAISEPHLSTPELATHIGRVLRYLSNLLLPPQPAFER